MDTLDKETAKQEVKQITRRRRYSDREKAAGLLALELEDGCHSSAARVAGVNRGTLYGWERGEGVPEDTRILTDALRPRLADVLEGLAYEFLDECDDDRKKRASLLQLVTSAAICVDKMRLLRGEATSIAGSQMSEDERKARIIAVLAREGLLPSDMGEAGGKQEEEQAEHPLAEQASLPEQDENTQTGVPDGQ